MDSPHPLLVPLLERHGLSWAEFSKRGRPAPGIRDKKSALVTELHATGLKWEQFREITGLSMMTIGRLSEPRGDFSVMAEKELGLGR